MIRERDIVGPENFEANQFNPDFKVRNLKPKTVRHIIEGVVVTGMALSAGATAVAKSSESGVQGALSSSNLTEVNSGGLCGVRSVQNVEQCTPWIKCGEGFKPQTIYLGGGVCDQWCTTAEHGKTQADACSVIEIPTPQQK